MTKLPDSADRPATEPSEIEITPEMIRAGEDALLDVVCDSDVRVGLIGATELSAVYKAMRRLEP
jgi:predicted acyltransferase (DUF342 family)